MNHCCICQQPLYVKTTSWLCRNCRIEYELSIPYKDWPDWAKECKQTEHQARRLYAAVDEMEIPFADLGIDIADFAQTTNGSGFEDATYG